MSKAIAKSCENHGEKRKSEQESKENERIQMDKMDDATKDEEMTNKENIQEGNTTGEAMDEDMADEYEQDFANYAFFKDNLEGASEEFAKRTRKGLLGLVAAPRGA